LAQILMLVNELQQKIGVSVVLKLVFLVLKVNDIQLELELFLLL
jgi:hypothetical protein